MHLFSGKELAMKQLLQKIGYANISLIHSVETSGVADLIVVNEKDAISASRIAELMSQGIKVLLLYNAGEILGGAWQQRSSLAHRKMILTPGVMGKFSKTFVAQQERDLYFLTSPYPENWKPYAGNHEGYTLLFFDKGLGTQGALFTYNPEHLTMDGQRFLNVIIDFLLNIKNNHQKR